MELKYLTRAQSDPRWKERVFFVSEPQDREAWLPLLSEMILNQQDCAIYYLDNELDGDRDELLEHLAEFQLVVIPVTQRLLTNPRSFIIGHLVRAAIQHHVALLPVLTDPDLLSKYQKTPLATLQYLDLSPSDATTLSPEEKLRSFLDACLAGAELAERVRKEFDGYIFLSYRKRDRQYAQELMRRIHKSPLCQSIAIWYDEYLVPGEDFNESIARALEASDVFALVVTPSLLEPENYVMRNEYPMAAARNMPIEPVRAAPVDAVALAEHYHGLSQVIDASNPYELTALWERLQKATGTPKPRGDEHDYLIGVAYLFGIDVETDAERALKLIERAAQNGHYEALKRLSRMYASGTGVKADLRAAEHYGLLAIDAQKDTCAQTGAGEDIDELLYLANELTNLYDLMGDHSGGVSLYKDLWEFVRKLPSPSVEQLVEMLMRLGFHEDCAQHTADARTHLSYALTLANGMGLGGYRMQQEMACVLDGLGDTELKLGNWDEARQAYQQFVHISRQLTQAHDDIGSKHMLAIGLGKLGDMYLRIKDYNHALAYQSESVKTARQLASGEHGFKNFGRNLVNALTKYGNGLFLSGHVEEARVVLNEARATAERVIEKTGTYGAHRNLSLVLLHLSQVVPAKEALALLSQAITIRKWLIGQCGLPTDQLYLGRAAYSAMLICNNHNLFSEGIAFGKEAAEALRAYAQRGSELEVHLFLAGSHQLLGYFYAQVNDHVRAKEHLLTAIRICETVCGTNDNTKNIPWTLTKSLLQYAEELQLEGVDALGRAWEYCERAYTNARSLVARDSSLANLLLLMEAAYKLAELAFIEDNYKVTYDLCGVTHQAFSIADAADREYLKAQRLEAQALTLDARALEWSDEIEPARQAYGKALNYIRSVFGQTGDKDLAEQYVTTAVLFGKMSNRTGQKDYASYVYDTGLEFARMLAEQVGEESHLLDLVTCLWGAACSAPTKEQKVAFLQEALGTCDALDATYPDNMQCRMMRVSIVQALGTNQA